MTLEIVSVKIRRYLILEAVQVSIPKSAESLVRHVGVQDTGASFRVNTKRQNLLHQVTALKHHLETLTNVIFDPHKKVGVVACRDVKCNRKRADAQASIYPLPQL